MGVYEKMDWPKKVPPDEPQIELIDDTAYYIEPIEQYDDGTKIVRRIPVMTKDIFIKCYVTWILNNHLEDDHK